MKAKKLFILFFVLIILLSLIYGCGIGLTKIQKEIIQFMETITYMEEEMMAEVDASIDIEEQIRIIENAYEKLYTIYVPEPCEGLYNIQIQRYQNSIDMWYLMYELLYIREVSEEEFFNNKELNELEDKFAQFESDIIIEQNKISRDHKIEFE